jgi:hypothetical protein
LAGRYRDFDFLFRFERLMNPVAPLAALRQTPREFVDDHNLAILNDVLSIEMKVAIHFDRSFDVLIQIDQADRT